MAKSPEQLLMLIVFLPVVLHFIIAIYLKIRTRKISTLPSTPEKGSIRKKLVSFLFIVALFLFLLSVSIVQVQNKLFRKQPLLTPTQEVLPTQEPVPASPSAFLIRVISDNPKSLVNIRSEASSEAAVLKKAAVHDTFPFIATHHDWYEIILDQTTTGFIYKEYGAKETVPPVK